MEVPRGQTDRWKDTTKLTVVFRNFANAPENRMKEYWDKSSFVNVRLYESFMIPFFRYKTTDLKYMKNGRKGERSR